MEYEELMHENSTKPASTASSLSPWQSAHREAAAQLRILDEAKCRACAGFGWTNMYHGHFSTRDKNYDHVCLICDGKGWRKGINLMDLIHAVK
jgi:hypothetical protein